MCVVHIFFNFTRASLSNTPICRHCFYTYLIYHEFYPYTISYKYIKNIAFFYLILHTTKVTFFLFCFMSFIILYTHVNALNISMYIYAYISCVCVSCTCVCDERD